MLNEKSHLNKRRKYVMKRGKRSLYSLYFTLQNISDEIVIRRFKCYADTCFLYDWNHQEEACGTSSSSFLTIFSSNVLRGFNRLTRRLLENRVVGCGFVVRRFFRSTVCNTFDFRIVECPVRITVVREKNKTIGLSRVFNRRRWLAAR